MIVIAALAGWQWREAYAAKDTYRQLALTNIIQRLQGDDVPALITDSQDDVAALLALQASQFGAEVEPNPVSFGMLNNALAPYPFAHVLGSDLGTMNAVAFSPDGRRVAVVGQDNKVHLWTVDDRRTDGAPLDGPPAGALTLAFSPDGQRLAVGGCASRQGNGPCSQGDLRIFDLSSRQVPLQLPAPPESEVYAVAFQPSPASGSLSLVWGSANGQLGSWNPDDPNAVPSEVPVLEGGVFAAAFSPDGRLLAVGGCEQREGEGDVDERQCRTGQVKLFDPLHLPERPAFFGPWGRRQSVVSGLAALRGLNGKDVLSLAFDEGGTLLAAGSGGAEGGNVQLWDVRTRPPRCHATGEAGSDEADCTLQDPVAPMKTPVTAVAFKPDDSEVVASDYDMVRFWKLGGLGQPYTNLALGYPNAVTDFSFRPQDDLALVTGSTDGNVRLWEWARSYTLPVEHIVGHVPRDEEDDIWGLAFDPDPALPLLVSGSDSGKLLAWDWTAPDAEPAAPPLPDDSPSCNQGAEIDAATRGAVWSVAISGNGRLLAAGYGDGSIRLWDVVDRHTFRPRATPLCPQPQNGQASSDPAIRSLSFNADGHHLASGSWDGSVLVWDTDLPQAQPTRLESGSQTVRAVTFNPDGDVLAVGGCKER